MPDKPPVHVGSQAAGPTSATGDKATEEEMKPQRHTSESTRAKPRPRKGERASTRRSSAAKKAGGRETARTKRKVENVPEDELTVDDLDSVEGTDAKLIDIPRLVAEAKLRRQTMEANMPITGRTMDNIDQTFSANVIKLVAGNQQALANAIRALASERADLLDSLSASKAYKRKALAVQVDKGDYDL